MGKAVWDHSAFRFAKGRMMVFGDYARYYDLLYQDKPYEKETEFVATLFQRYASRPVTSLLELGSGTGKHAYYFAKKGFSVHGVEKSPVMLSVAKDFFKLDSVTRAITLQQGDIGTLQLERSFDAIFSLFHVLSYQTTQAALEAVFSVVHQHLAPGGVFVFDSWYGPGVLLQKPKVRYKYFANETLQVERVAVPTLLENKNQVNVQYHVFIKEKNTDYYTKLEETHSMRYFFLSEISALCKQFNLRLLHTCEWLSAASLSGKVWGACFVVAK